MQCQVKMSALAHQDQHYQDRILVYGSKEYADVPMILIIPCLMFFAKKKLFAAQSIYSSENQDFSDSTLFAEINSPMLLINESSTPKKKQSFSQEVRTLDTTCNTR